MRRRRSFKRRARRKMQARKLRNYRMSRGGIRL